MKTILFKIWKFPQLSETFIVNQVVLAIRLGYEVQILVGEFLDISRNGSLQLFEQYNLKDKIIIEDYKVPSSKFHRILMAGYLILKNIRYLTKLRRFYKESQKKGLIPLYEFCFYKKFRGIDFIHIQFGTNKHPVDILKKAGFLKSKIIVSFHGHDLHFPINKRIPNNGYYDTLFNHADCLIVNTPFLDKKLIALKAPKEKIKVIPVAVNTEFFKPIQKEKHSNSIQLLTVGRLDELKGQKYGIDVVNKLVSSGYNVEYHIAGQGSWLEILQSHVQKLGLDKYVFFTGAVSSEQVKELMQKADIFLMTSVTNSEGMAESQGLVTAEAQACGLPIVAFDSGGIRYTLQEGKTGFLCAEKDLDCYTSKIERLIVEEDLRIKMRNNAVEFILKNYSDNSVKEKWKKIYQ